MKTFRKAIAIMLTLVFMLSLVSVNVMADAQEIHKVEMINEFYGDSSARDYSTFLRAANTPKSGYRAFFQFDFSGYEYLLRDEQSGVKLSVQGGTTSTSAKTYDFNMFVLKDRNDEYARLYKPYGNGLTYNSLSSVLIAGDFFSDVPFATKVESDATTKVVLLDGNKQLILDALDDSKDDSVVTFQFVGITNSGKTGFTHESENTFLQIDGVSEDATPQSYVNDVADMITWETISSEPIKKVTSNLELPKNYLGVDIGWESSNDNAIIASSGEVIVNHEENTYVTLTATFTYKAYTGETVTAKKEFDIRIPGAPYDYSTGTGTFYDGSNDFIAHSGSSATHVPSYQKIGGIRGKATDDKCYEIRDASGNRRYNVPEISPDVPTKIDIIEFDVCVPEGCYGFSAFMKLYHDINDTTKGGTSLTEFLFKDDGIWHSRYNTHLVKYDGTKWHHIAIVSPGIISSDENGYVFSKTVKIYVDGVEAYSVNAPSEYVAPFGISYCQLNGLCPMEYYDSTTKTWSAVAGYIDNLKFTNDSIDDIIAYNTKSSVASSYELDEAAGVISVMFDSTTVADVIDSLTIDEDATARIYDSSWNLLTDDVVVSDDCILVVADTNGTTSERSFAYYDIRVIEDGTMEFDASVIESEDGNVNGSVKLYNNTDAAKNYDVYLVVYSEKEAVTVLEPVTLSVDGGSVGTVDTASVAFANGNIAKVLVWEQGTTTPAIKSVQYK